MALRKLKICVLGDKGVGKTEFISRLCKSKRPETIHKAKVTEYLHIFTNGFAEGAKFEVWEIPDNGENPISYFDDVDLFIILYDVTDEMGMINAEKWMKYVGNVPLLVYGTKYDLIFDKRKATTTDHKMVTPFSSGFQKNILDDIYVELFGR